MSHPGLATTETERARNLVFTRVGWESQDDMRGERSTQRLYRYADDQVP